MAEVDFADGFDVSEPLLWGLAAPQVGTLIAGAVLGYLAIRSPLAPVGAIPLAVVVAGAACALALGRYEGRTLISWAGAAVRFRARPRHGLLLVTGGAGGEASDQWAAHSSHPAPPLAVVRAGVDGHAGPPPAHVQGRGLPGAAAGERDAAPLETPRRVPLVLLPEPVSSPEADDGPPGREQQPPIGPPPDLGVAGGAVLEARAAARIRDPGGGGPLDLWAAAPTTLRATRRITFFSLAGGTGRTTLAVEVAGLLASRAAAPWPAPGVALLDLDLLSPRASIRLGVPLLTGWAEAVSELPMRGGLERLLSVLPSGLRVVPGPAPVPLPRWDGGPLPLSPAAAWDATVGGALPDGGWQPDRSLLPRLSCLVTEMERQGCDTLILDVPAGLGPVTRWALDAAHDIVVVLTPTAGGVQDAYRSTEALRRLGLARKLRYAVNRSCGDHPFAEAMGDLGGSIAAEVPEDPALERAEAEHRLVAAAGSGAAARALRALAATVDARLATPRNRRSAHRLLGRRAV